MLLIIPGRCRGGWIAPYWCDTLQDFYTSSSSVELLQGHNITGNSHEKAVKARRELKTGDRIGPYIGYIVSEDDRQLRHEQQTDTHIAQAGNGVFIDPNSPDKNMSIYVDVGFMAAHYPELPNLAVRMNTAGPMRHVVKNNCRFQNPTPGDDYIIWILAACHIHPGYFCYASAAVLIVILT